MKNDQECFDLGTEKNETAFNHPRKRSERTMAMVWRHACSAYNISHELENGVWKTKLTIEDVITRLTQEHLFSQSPCIFHCCYGMDKILPFQTFGNLGKRRFRSRPWSQRKNCIWDLSIAWQRRSVVICRNLFGEVSTGIIQNRSIVIISEICKRLQAIPSQNDEVCSHDRRQRLDFR